jgi:hypothetical protein
MHAATSLTGLLLDSVVNSDFDSAIVTTVFTGRPLRAQSNVYLDDWEKNRQDEIKDLTSRGIVPLEHELDKLHAEGKLTEEIEDHVVLRYVYWKYTSAEKYVANLS